MMSAGEIVREAREWIGTPYHHQARVKGAGCDCVGLFIGIGESVGIPAMFESDYPVTFKGRTLRSYLVRNCTEMREVGLYDAPVGAILAFTMRQDEGPHHVALRTPDGMLHAWSTGVVEHGLRWLERLDSVWWHPEVIR